MPNRKIRAVEEVLFIVFFVVAISAPLALLLVRGEGTAAWENRRLAELPHRPTTAGEAFHLPRMLTEYFKDHFGLRAEMIRWQAVAKVRWLRTSSSPEVIIGKNGWLFHSGGQQVELYSGARPFKEDELARWQSFLESTRDWLKGFDAELLFVVAPEKQTIYPELMPDGIIRVRAESRQDQLLKYLKEHSNVRAFDLRPALFESKNRNQIYLQTDTHWNGLGGLAAYQSIVRELARNFEGMQPLSASDCEPNVLSGQAGDLAGMLGLHDVLTEEKFILRPKQPRARFEGNCGDPGECISRVEGSSMPRLFMLRDSFSSYFIPLLAEHFSRGVYVWDMKHGMHADLIKAERPNIVIIEITERSLMLPPPEGLPSPH